MTQAADSESEAPASEQGVTVHISAKTDVGLVREHNEDAFLLVRLHDNCRVLETLAHHKLDELGTLLQVCDGMGGAAAGEVASAMATEIVADAVVNAAPMGADLSRSGEAGYDRARGLRAAAYEANSKIFEAARQEEAKMGMGTTLTGALLTPSLIVLVQVGDSRAYVFRQGQLVQVTRDQSLVNELIQTGHITAEQAKFYEHSNVILQALGVQPDVEVLLSRVAYCKGDRLLLCSDGLVGVVSDEEIAAVLGTSQDPDEASRVLIDLARSAGGPDNITVIVVHFSGDLPDAKPNDPLTYNPWPLEVAEGVPERMGEVETNKLRDAALVSGSLRNEFLRLVGLLVLLLVLVVVGGIIYRSKSVCVVHGRPGATVELDDSSLFVSIPPSGMISIRVDAGDHQFRLRREQWRSTVRSLRINSSEIVHLEME